MVIVDNQDIEKQMTELAIASANPAADWGVVVPISHSAVLVVDDFPWTW
jgi:hypothetical protein